MKQGIPAIEAIVIDGAGTRYGDGSNTGNILIGADDGSNGTTIPGGISTAGFSAQPLGALADGNSEVAIEIGAGGRLVILDLPAADPHIAGHVWSNAGVLTVSAG